MLFLIFFKRTILNIPNTITLDITGFVIENYFLIKKWKQ